MDAAHDLTSEVKPLFVCWVIRSSCMKALFKLKRSVRKKKTKQQQHTMDADKQRLNKALGSCKTTENLLAASILYPAANKATQIFC